MPSVQLDPHPPDTFLGGLPCRVKVSAHELEHLARVVGVPLPWGEPAPSPLTETLGPTRQPCRTAGPTDLSDTDLLGPDGDPAPEIVDALRVLAAADVAVDVDLCVRRRHGSVQLRSWHRLAGGRITTLSTADSLEFELGWLSVELWQAELARAVTVPPASRGTPVEAEVPFELLLASGEAIRRNRPEVLGELVTRYAAPVPPDVDLVPLLHTLETEVRGRMRATVAHRSATSGAVGLVAWVLLPSGWHALTPHTRDREPMVRVHPVHPMRLGVEVAALVTRAGRGST